MPTKPRRPTQCDLILECLLQQARTCPADPWVAMPHLSRVSGSLNVHSRISNLRDRGYSIAHRQSRRGDGTMLSDYCVSEGVG